MAGTALSVSAELTAVSERLTQHFGWTPDSVLAGRAAGFWWLSEAVHAEPSQLRVWLGVHSKNFIELADETSPGIAELENALHSSLADLLFHTLVAGWSAGVGTSEVVGLVREVSDAYEPLAIGANGHSKIHKILASRHVVPAVDFGEQADDSSFADLALEYMRASRH